LTYRSDTTVAEQALRALHASGIAAECLRLDAGSADVVTTLGANARFQSASRLAVIHNAAAGFAPTPVHLLDWEQFELQLNVGLRGLVSLARAALPRMARTGGGVIAVVLSRAVLEPPPKGFAAYVAAKQAMRSVVKSLAVEHHPRGVRTFSVCPGYMPSALTDAWDAALRLAAERSGATDVDAAARELHRLVTAADTGEIPGAGEDYAI
jgi:NAD(P)-dependent dehydrogenase (short-subunit alcohol dehydrogenase family)